MAVILQRRTCGACAASGELFRVAPAAITYDTS